MKTIKFLLLAALMLTYTISTYGQDKSHYMPKFAIKTNALYWATTTANLGFEVGLSKKLTLDVSGNYNPWKFSDHKQIKHWLGQPGLLYWLGAVEYGHFFGLHAHYAEANVSNLNILGLGHERYQGNIYGAGISYGYQWILNKHWSMEAEIGVGYARIDYDKYNCGKCGSKLDSGHKNYIGPTKVALNIIYVIK